MDTQVERLPVGSNRLGISIERQEKKPAGGKERRLSDKSVKGVKRAKGCRQVTFTLSKTVSRSRKWSCSHAPMHSNKGLLVFYIFTFELRARLRVSSYHVTLLYIFYQCFPITLARQESVQCWKIYRKTQAAKANNQQLRSSACLCNNYLGSLRQRFFLPTCLMWILQAGR